MPKKINAPGKKTKEDQNLTKKKSNEPVAIVGIGASAGGIEAFSSLIKDLPDDTGMAYILVQHLQPQRESKLTEIFSTKTSMPVVQVKDHMDIKPNHIYIIPPDKYLTIGNKRLLLSQREKTDGIYMPIDYFFESLAIEEKSKAIGIILSGTASDGTLGLKAIKAEGGLTFAQDHKSAKYPGMPTSAVDSGFVDIVLPPENIAKELIRIGKHPYIALTPPLKEKEIEPEEEDSLTKIFRKIRSVTDVDFSHYKLSTVKRRINRRMVVNKIETIEDYAKFIKENKKEVNELYHDLLIKVTNFFRDPEVFETLKKTIFPQITKHVSSSNPVRIWIPGCSTGEEVYSIAISLFEYLEKKSANYYIQIFATDISEPAIEKARTGYYSESLIKDVSKQHIKKYFVKVNGGYQIIKAVRDLCIFARQDISKDPPFSRIDLISCRNLLIYLSPDLQKKIIPIFHYSLKTNGVLLLGTSESIGSFADLFSIIDNKFKIYEKKQIGNKIDYQFNLSGLPQEKNKVAQKIDIASNLDIQKEADRIILDHFSPPGVLVNQNLEIIQIRGNINQYLGPKPGEASLNLFKMMKEGISLELHTTIRKAKKTGKPAAIENILLSSNGNQRKLDIEVVPIKQSDLPEVFFLILFKEKHEYSLAKSDLNTYKGDKKGKKGKINRGEMRYEKLKEELLITKEHLQSIIEEREATNEELRSALEELQSSNEELQSTNEEMETTREELQSTNEELITVNDELEGRNTELNKLNNDLNNILFSVNIPIIMLSRDLKIRRFTPRAEKIWNLISGDIGRAITNITPNIIVDELTDKINDVIDHLDPKEIEVKDQENNWYSMKIRPYRTIDNKIDGVVITLFDIDKMKKDFDKALAGKNFAEVVFNTVREPLLILEEDLKIREANDSFLSNFKYKKEEVIDKLIYSIGKGEWDGSDFKKTLEEKIKWDSASSFEFSIKSETSKKLIINVSKFLDASKNYILVAMREKVMN